MTEKEKKFAKIISSSIISNLPAHIFWEDLEGQFLGCNDQQAKSIGLEKAEDLIGKTIWEIAELLGWDKKMIEQIRHNDLEVVRSGKAISVEETVTWTDGKTRTYLSKKAPIKDENDTCIGMLGIALDITERKDMEKKLVEAKEQAEEANHAKMDFVANISHDIRTPLHAILGTAELLKLKPFLPEQKEYLDAIMQSGDTLLKLIENVLDFSKLGQANLELKEEPVDLLSLIQNTVAAVTPQARLKGLKIIVDFADDVSPHIISNADALRRILINLLGNALKFTKEGQITVAVETANATNHTVWLNLIIKDTGIGIPPHAINHIFDRFYRVNPSSKEKYKGAGLGLAIIKKLVDTLKGTIIVESYPGVGTKFTCTLPFRRDTHRKKKLYVLNDPSMPIYSRSKKLSVLLIEDMPLIQKFSDEILQLLNCDVTIASNGAQALEYVNTPFDLILLDLGLPDEDGLNVAQKIRNSVQNRNTPIIALTANATDEAKQSCLLAGINDFLAKPASYNTLLQCINKYAG